MGFTFGINLKTFSWYKNFLKFTSIYHLKNHWRFCPHNTHTLERLVAKCKWGTLQWSQDTVINTKLMEQSRIKKLSPFLVGGGEAGSQMISCIASASLGESPLMQPLNLVLDLCFGVPTSFSKERTETGMFEWFCCMLTFLMFKNLNVSINCLMCQR